MPELRTVTLGLNDSNQLSVYFALLLVDGTTPALNEAGGQPQVMINTVGWNPSGIGVLVHDGFGRYHTAIDSAIITTVGDIIQTRYASSLVKETPGDTFQVLDSNGRAKLTDAALNVLSYMTVLAAEQYFASRLNSQSWDNASDANKLKALRQATRIIDRLNFAGDKSDPNQLLQFPRGTVVINPYFSNILNGSNRIISDLRDTDVPADIKNACCEIAFALLDGVDPEEELQALTADSHGYANVKTSYNRKFVPAHVLAGVPSATAWTYLVPYLRDPRELSVERAN